MRHLVGSLLILVAFILSSQARAQFIVKTGAELGIGTMDSETGSIEKRDMNFISIYGLPAYSYMGFYAGINLEARMVGQTTKASKVGNTNLKGIGHTAGIAIGYEYEKFFGHLGYDFYGDYTLDKKTASGQKSVFTEPSGFRILAGYKVMPQLSVDLSFVMDSYSNNKVGGTSTDISSDKLEDTRYGVGATYHFSF